MKAVGGVGDEDEIVVEERLQPRARHRSAPIRDRNATRMLANGRLGSGDAFDLAQHAFAVIGERAGEQLALVSSATSSARCAEVSTATTTQTIATATITPIGTTTLRRGGSNRPVCAPSPISDGVYGQVSKSRKDYFAPEP